MSKRTRTGIVYSDQSQSAKKHARVIAAPLVDEEVGSGAAAADAAAGAVAAPAEFVAPDAMHNPVSHALSIITEFIHFAATTAVQSSGVPEVIDRTMEGVGKSTLRKGAYATVRDVGSDFTNAMNTYKLGVLTNYLSDNYDFIRDSILPNMEDNGVQPIIAQYIGRDQTAEETAQILMSYGNPPGLDKATAELNKLLRPGAGLIKSSDDAQRDLFRRSTQLQGSADAVAYDKINVAGHHMSEFWNTLLRINQISHPPMGAGFGMDHFFSQLTATATAATTDILVTGARFVGAVFQTYRRIIIIFIFVVGLMKGVDMHTETYPQQALTFAQSLFGWTPEPTIMDRIIQYAGAVASTFKIAGDKVGPIPIVFALAKIEAQTRAKVNEFLSARGGKEGEGGGKTRRRKRKGCISKKNSSKKRASKKRTSKKRRRSSKKRASKKRCRSSKRKRSPTRRARM